MDSIDITAADWRPSRVSARAAIRAAVEVVAGSHDGLVHIADVRPLIPKWADPHQVGAIVCALVRQGVLERTGDYRPNGGGKSRNALKPAAVYRLTRPIPAEDAA